MHVAATMACHGSVRAGPPAQARGDERAAARDGSDAELRPVQPRPPDLCGAEAHRHRAAVRAALIGGKPQRLICIGACGAQVPVGRRCSGSPGVIALALAAPARAEDWPNRPVTHGGAVCGRRRLRHPRRASSPRRLTRTSRPADRDRERRRRRRHDRRGARRQGRARRLSAAVRRRVAARAGAAHAQEAALRRRHATSRRWRWLPSSRDPDRAQRFPGRQLAGLHRLRQGQPEQDAVRLARRGLRLALACALLDVAMGIKITHVPYRGRRPPCRT